MPDLYFPSHYICIYLFKEREKMTFKRIRTFFLISLTSEIIADLQYKYWNFTKNIGLNWKMEKKKKKIL